MEGDLPPRLEGSVQIGKVHHAGAKDIEGSEVLLMIKAKNYVLLSVLSVDKELVIQ